MSKTNNNEITSGGVTCFCYSYMAHSEGGNSSNEGNILVGLHKNLNTFLNIFLML